MGEPLSPDRVFDFPIDEPEPHSAYDFFAPGLLPRYAGNPNNNNRWIEADVPLLGKLGEMDEPRGAEVDESMVVPAIEEVTEPIDEAEKQMVALIVDMDEDIAMLFVDDDASEGFDERWLEGPSTAAFDGTSFFSTPQHSGLIVPLSPSVIKDLSTDLGNLEYGYGQLVKKVIHVSDTEVAAGVTIGEIGPMVFAIEGQVQVMASQMVHAADSYAAKRHTDLAAADYGIRDEQS
ncbi:hypothetical protein Tco_0200579 [Tanacetum coccineum]